ncbi:MAG: hypothetical protein K5910_05420 [Bacteroidales bacterium]|nr:hypothetical protein [Bacteroidales bacterium]
MKKILRWFLAAAVLASAMACSKELAISGRHEFDAEWAEAYYYGTDDLGGVGSFQLDLAQGRTNEDLDLISSGAVVRLLISAPLDNSISLPDGLYLGSETREIAYTFNYGSLQADKTIVGSYVGLRPGRGKQMQLYPIEEGMVSVNAAEDGEYQVSVQVKTASETFQFSYAGVLRTVDCSGP